MFETILKLQQKPTHIRKQIAFAISGVIVFIIAVIWIATFEIPVPPKAKEDVERNNLAPLTLLKDQFQNLFVQ